MLALALIILAAILALGLYQQQKPGIRRNGLKLRCVTCSIDAECVDGT